MTEYEFVKCDILNSEAVKAIVSTGFDYVYNFAGLANLDDAVEAAPV